MIWLLLTLSCIIFWGIGDILYKASSDYNDPLAHHKTFVWIGVVMGLAGCISMVFSDTLPDSISIGRDNLYLAVLAVFLCRGSAFRSAGQKTPCGFRGFAP